MCVWKGHQSICLSIYLSITSNVYTVCDGDVLMEGHRLVHNIYRRRDPLSLVDPPNLQLTFLEGRKMFMKSIQGKRNSSLTEWEDGESGRNLRESKVGRGT